MIATVRIKVPNPSYPFGVRDTGEEPLLPPMAEIANAINAAIGVRTEKLPVSSGAILESMWEEGRGG